MEGQENKEERIPLRVSENPARGRCGPFVDVCIRARAPRPCSRSALPTVGPSRGSGSHGTRAASDPPALAPARFKLTAPGKEL